MCTQSGAALAVLLLPRVGPVGVVVLRLLLSGVLLLALSRQRLTSVGAEQRRAIAVFAGVLVVMNVAFYEAVDRLPLGAVTALGAIGPLTLTVVLSRRLQGVLWAAVAFAGVVLLSGGGGGELDAVGSACALLAGAAWAGYIVAGSKVGRQAPGVTGLALSMLAAGTVTIPLLVVAGPYDLRVSTPFVALSVAVLGCALPYALELAAMRRVSPAVFGVLTGIQPAVAVLVGFLALDQRLSLVQLGGIALVVTAGVGASTRLPAPVPSAPP